MASEAQVHGDILVTVEALDEDEQTFRWARSAPSRLPLRDLAQLWAESHSVPADCVGLAGELEEALDLARSPAELGWAGAARVFAVPLDPAYGPRSRPAAAAARSSDAAARSADLGAKAADACPPRAARGGKNAAAAATARSRSRARAPERQAADGAEAAGP
eukprot:TRINITY_DN40236_c0_g1_i1.p1 TRINITY_DN40236_c0_g1~~TRINITY_DN40236_c0_g1_i1.p1  ORF type:complete len:162 (-),score=32.79 TRINITY_DN40236_c0_g1_i1:117-602(-)